MAKTPGAKDPKGGGLMGVKMPNTMPASCPDRKPSGPPPRMGKNARSGSGRNRGTTPS